MDYGNDRYRDDKYYDDYGGDQYGSNRGQGNSYDQYPPPSSGGSRHQQHQFGQPIGNTNVGAVPVAAVGRQPGPYDKLIGYILLFGCFILPGTVYGILMILHWLGVIDVFKLFS